MEERAIRERWPMSDKVRVQLLKRLVGLVDPETEEGAQADARTVVAASRALLAADKLNLDQRRLDLAEEKMRRDEPDATERPTPHAIPDADPRFVADGGQPPVGGPEGGDAPA